MKRSREAVNVFVIGKGGREHAIIESLKKSDSADQIYSYPGREGFDVERLKFDSKSNDLSPEDFISPMKKKNIDLIIIGPEQELANGWSDVFRENGFLVFGPSQKASQLEASKIFSKQFMKSANIPSAPYQIVESVSQTIQSAQKFSPPYVLKADGLCAGKGVFICSTKEELKQKAEQLFDQKIFGESGRKALLEKFQKGRELSIFIFTNGQSYITLPVAQDYKKLNEENKGPNTGGMGAICPIDVDASLMQKIDEKILKPTISAVQKQNLFYRGVLYVGLIIVEDEPLVLEYNVRFGDPECQTLLPLIEGDAAQIFYEIAQGKLSKLNYKNRHSCCVVLSEKDYPDHPKKGAVIGKDLFSKTDQAYFLHAGTKKSEDGSWIVDGGRVLNAVALGALPQEARDRAYQLAHSVQSRHLYFRKDIG